jgi:hypothetical protein
VNEEDNEEDDIKEELTGLISDNNKDEDEDEDENKDKDKDEDGDEDEDNVNRCNERNRCSLSQNGKGIVCTNALLLLKGYVRTP